MKELLVRCRYLLYKYEDEWTVNQTRRAAILFEKYPLLKHAYMLTLAFRNIYNNFCKQKALSHFVEWQQDVAASQIDEFNAAAK